MFRGMALVNLSLRNYRCFAERQDVELRPITVVLGKNNSGKSALVRAPMILQAGIRNDHPIPLDLEQFGDDAPEFIDLVNGRNEVRGITVGLVLTGPEGRKYSLDTTIQNVPEFFSQRILEWSLRSGDDAASYTWVLGDGREGLEQPVFRRPDGSSVSLDFRGLVPTALPDGDGAGWFDADGIRSSYDAIRHLGPFRFKPKRAVRLSTREPDRAISKSSGDGWV